MGENKTLKIGFIGLGLRGEKHLINCLKRDDVEIYAICDIEDDRRKISLDIIRNFSKKTPFVFGSNDFDYKNLLSLQEIDAVIVSTSWKWGKQICIDSMLAGKYTGVEVFSTNTVQDSFDLVNAHLKSGSKLMVLANVVFRKDIMSILNMVKKGVFGELIHLRGAYQHDLRKIKLNINESSENPIFYGDKAKGEAKWRTYYSIKRNADVYPFHGIAPLALMCNINRGNKFTSITSIASKSIGLSNYVKKHSKNQNLKFKQGDVITSIISTENGETILLTHDCNLPRPYSLGYRVQGTNGLWEFDGNRIYLEDVSEVENEWEDAKKYIDKYSDPKWNSIEENEDPNNRGMDLLVLDSFINSVKNNENPPLDIYDLATWCAITPLSELSIEKQGQAIDFPDFKKC